MNAPRTFWNRFFPRADRARAAEVQASEERFEAIFHSVNDAVFIHNLTTGAIVDVNRRMCTMYGCTRQQALQASPDQLSSGTAPYDAVTALSWLAEAADGDPRVFPWHCRRLDGTLFWGEVGMRRARIGAVDRIVVTVRDITERRQVEEALRERLTLQQRLEALANATPGVLFVFRRGMDGTMSFPFASPRIEEVYGVPREALIKDGSAAFQLVHPDDRAAVQSSIAESADSLQQWFAQFRVQHPVKGTIWVEGHATPERAPDGTIVWHGFAYDNTARVEADTQLRQLNAILRVRAACDRALVRAGDEPTLLNSVCATAVAAGGFRMAWIGLAEDDEARSVRAAAVAGHEAGYLSAVRISWSDTEEGRGPTGTAIRTGQVVVARDLGTDAIYGRWREEGLKRGYAASVAIPILAEGRAIGALMIYSTRPGDFGPEEVTVLAELTTNLGVRIETLRAKALRLRAQEALRQSENRLVQAIRVSQIGIFDHDHLAGTMYCSAELRAIYGMSPDQPASISDYLMRIHPEDRERVAEAVRCALAPGGAGRFDLEARMRRPDGSIRWLTTQAETSFAGVGQDRRPVRTVGAVVDVTERRQAEEARHASEVRVQHVLEAADCLLWQARVSRRETGEFDWDFYIPRSSLYHRLFGVDPGDPPHLMWQELAVPELDAMHAACFKAITSGASSYDQEFHATVEGRTVWLREQVSISRDCDRKWMLVGVITDITDRVLAEATRKRMEEQLMHAQRLESVGRLAGGIAHDLNNILTPILLGAPLLREVASNPGASETLCAMEISAKRGAEIIAQLLTFSRGSTGKRVSVQMQYVVRDMSTMIREMFPKNITARVDFPSRLWTVNGNPTQLHQVLMNLCVNARDAMPEGGLLSIVLENVEVDDAITAGIAGLLPGPYVLVSIADTGVGIAPEHIDKIFDPFFTTKEVGKGTGLGLATVLGIVKSHGGVVQVASQVGEGTQFRVYLPATPGVESTTEHADPSLPDGNGETILLVDDETTVRTIVRKLLERHHYCVVEAGDGLEALAQFVRHQRAIAVVLTDLLMPVLDGVAFMRRLRSLDPRVPVVVASGHADHAVFSAIEAGEVQAFVAKPYSATELLECLHGVLLPVVGTSDKVMAEPDQTEGEARSRRP